MAQVAVLAQVEAVPPEVVVDEAAANDNVMAQVAQAKTGLMGGMWPGEQTTKAYNESKTKMPKAIAEANALIAKAQTLSTALTKYNISLPTKVASDP